MATPTPQEILDELSDLSQVGAKHVLPRVERLLQLLRMANVQNDSYINEKISGVSSWFKELTKTRGQYSYQDARSYALADLAALYRNIEKLQSRQP